jgi:hypothetical protein
MGYWTSPVLPDFSASNPSIDVTAFGSAGPHQSENTDSINFDGPSNTNGPDNLTALDGAQLDFHSSTADAHGLLSHATSDLIDTGLVSSLSDIGSRSDSFQTSGNSDQGSQVAYGVGHAGWNTDAINTQNINFSDSVSQPALPIVNSGQGTGSPPATINAGDLLSSASPHASIASADVMPTPTVAISGGEQPSGSTISFASASVSYNFSSQGAESNSAASAAGAGPSSSQIVTLAGSGLTFVNTFDSNDSSGYISAVDAAENFYQKNFSNNVTINLDFTTKAAGTNAFVAQTETAARTPVSYTQLINGLAANETTADAVAAVNAIKSLGDITSGAGFLLEPGEVKAFGMTPNELTINGVTGFDAQITLNLSDAYFFNGIAVSGEHDAISALEHEISEVMGRVGGLGPKVDGFWGAMDLFRYNAAGKLDDTGGSDGLAAYFSINGSNIQTGWTFNDPALPGSNTPFSGNGDTADWNATLQPNDQVGTQVTGGYDSYGASPTGTVGVVTPIDLEIMNVLGWDPIGTTKAAPSVIVNVQNISVAENKSIAASSLIKSLTNPSNDSITFYEFWDGGIGNGHFTVNGAIQPDGQWIVVSASNLSSIQYVGGASPGSESLYVAAYDATAGTWSNFSTLTATTVLPTTTITVNVQNVSVAENTSIAASSLIASVSNPSGDNITFYEFWDGGTGNGHFTVNGVIQPDGQWIVVSASNLSSIQYVGGVSPGSESLYVAAYDGTLASWSNYSTLTATTTVPHVAPTVNVQNVSVAENTSIAASSLIASVTNPSGDSITEYAFWDGGTGNGHFTVNGAIQPDGQWIYVLASNLSGAQYVGGSSPGPEPLFVDIYDATTGTWSNYGSLTATTTVPHASPIVNVQNVSVAANTSIAASSMITGLTNPSGDTITEYGFWDGGTGNGYFAVNGAVQPDMQWVDVSASSLSSVQYVGGTSAGAEALYVDVYDATLGTWSNNSALTATTSISTSVQQEDLGLYMALYNRAAEFPGYSFWIGTVSQQSDGAGVTVANAGTTAITLNDAAVLGQDFVNTQATFFNTTYGSLNDSSFINALYVNIGGNAGDPSGIAYWANILAQNEAGGQSVQAARAGLAGQFVHDLIDVNLASFTTLTPAQLLAAEQRQGTINNKIAVSLAYSNASEGPGGAILDPQTIGDAAYVAATTILQAVTYDPATVTAAITGINNAVAHQNLLLI